MSNQSFSDLVTKVSVNGEPTPIQKFEYLHGDMSFREAGKIAMSLYSQNEFVQFKEEFDQLRQQYATGLGSSTQIKMLDKKNEPTLKGIFSLMDEAQSQRFQQEFYDAMLPHWMSQHEIWKNLNEGKKGDYTYKLQGSWLNKMLFKFIAKMVPEQQFIDAVVMSQTGSWVDDDKKTVTLRARFK